MIILPEEQQQAFVVTWVVALRSGQYQQGRRGLRPGGQNKFCCLGVGCDVISPIVQGEWNFNVWRMNPGEGWGAAFRTTISSATSWPNTLRVMLEIKDSTVRTLMDLNDGQRDHNGRDRNSTTFDTIADFIVEHIYVPRWGRPLGLDKQ